MTNKNHFNLKINQMLIIFMVGIYLFLMSCESSSKSKEPIELHQLISSFIEEKSESNNALPWSWQAENPSFVDWETSGIEENNHYTYKTYPFIRKGTATIMLNDEVSHQVLKNHLEDGKWSVFLLGVRGFAQELVIDSQINSDDLNPFDIENYLSEFFNLNLINHDKEESTLSYTLITEDNIKANLNLSYSCGTAGCHIAILIQ